MGHRDLSTRASICCLPVSALTGSWKWESELESNPGTQIRDAGVLTCALSARPNAHPSFELFIKNAEQK